MIIIVDDEIIILKVLDEWIKRNCPQETLACGTFEDAVKIIQSTKPDLIFYDWNLPDMYGSAGLRRIRELTNVPIVVMSGDIGVEELAMPSGASEFVYKGDLNYKIDFCEIIRKWLPCN